MMVLRQVVSAAEGYCLQLMVGQVPAECKTGSAEGAMERVTGVFHAIGLEGGFQASFVERAVVSHQGQTFNQGYDFAPYLRERGGVGRILKGKPVNLCVPIVIVIGIGAYQTVVSDGNFPVADHHEPHAANAGTLPVGGLEIYGGKVVHVVVRGSVRLIAKIAIMRQFTVGDAINPCGNLAGQPCFDNFVLKNP